MKAGAEVLTTGQGGLEKALGITNRLSSEPERENNSYGIKTLAGMLADFEGTFFHAPHGVVSSPLGHLTIKVEPAFGIDLEGNRRLVTLWNTKTPDMTTALAAVGFGLMFDAVVRDDFGNCSCAIYDLRQKRRLVADATTETMRSAIRRELEWVDRLFEKFENEKEFIQQDDQPFRRPL